SGCRADAGCAGGEVAIFLVPPLRGGTGVPTLRVGGSCISRAEMPYSSGAAERPHCVPPRSGGTRRLLPSPRSQAVVALMTFRLSFLCLAFVAAPAFADEPAPVPASIAVHPSAVDLRHHRQPHSLQVLGSTPDGH